MLNRTQRNRKDTKYTSRQCVSRIWDTVVVKCRSASALTGPDTFVDDFESTRGPKLSLKIVVHPQNSDSPDAVSRDCTLMDNIMLQGPEGSEQILQYTTNPYAVSQNPVERLVTSEVKTTCQVCTPYLRQLDHC
jgi:hypothetical protein